LNNDNEAGINSNHIINKIKISPDKKLVQYLKDNILNDNHKLTKYIKMSDNGNKKKNSIL